MIYILTEGEFSDFAVLGIYEGPPGLDCQSLLAEFRRLPPPPVWWSEPPLGQTITIHRGLSRFRFLRQGLNGFLKSKGLLPVDHREWWLGYPPVERTTLPIYANPAAVTE